MGRGVGERGTDDLTHPHIHTYIAYLLATIICWLFRFTSYAHDIIIFYIFEARRALWAPRSVGPYGVGRAPTPLMHAPVGHAYGCPQGTHYRSRLSFSFRSRTSALRAPGSCNAPLRGAYGYPYGVPIIMGHPVGAPYVHPVGCTLYIMRVRVYVKPASCDLGHFTRYLGQN